MAAFINYTHCAFLWWVIAKYSLFPEEAMKYSEIGSCGIRSIGHANSQFLMYIVSKLQSKWNAFTLGDNLSS